MSHVETYGCELGEGGGVRVSVETGECEVGEGGGGMVSVCYRVEYGSLGGVLSRTEARELQLRLRERLSSQVEGLELQ